MKVGQLTTIRYTKSEDDVTVRDIIPTNVPKTFISAIDLTGLEDAQRESLIEAMVAYNQFLDEQRASLPKFEQFIEQHNLNVDLSTIKYRNYTTSKVEEI